MTFTSISIALPLAVVVAYAIGWLLRKRSSTQATGNRAHSMASLWAFSLSALIGVAALLSDGPVGMLRGAWPREAVDWLALAALAFTFIAALQRPSVNQETPTTGASTTGAQAQGALTLGLGLLLGTAIACRLLWGSIYLRPGHTSIQSLGAIAASGSLIGWCWYVELTRSAERGLMEGLCCAATGMCIAATLGMSGSFQYGMIGMLMTLAGLAAWASTRRWPWIYNLVMMLLLGLGLAFAEVQLPIMLGLCGAMVLATGLSWLPQGASRRSVRGIGLAAIVGVALLCVAWTGLRFSQEIKGKNADYGGYEALK